VIEITNLSTKEERINTKALSGLRGIMAIHVMVYHTLRNCEWEIDIMGYVPMTFFILMSGFVLALNDGKRIYSPTKCCTELCPDKEDKSKFDGKNFYQRRCARTIPLFWLTNLMAIPLFLLNNTFDWGTIVSIVMTIFTTNTWFFYPLFLNGPSWFVSTIWFYYWIFPSLLPRLQRYTAERKQKWLIIHFVIQLLIAVVFIVGVGLVFDDTGMIGFLTAYFWPVARLPQFIMGVLAGLLRNEGLGMRAKHSSWSLKQWSKCSNIMGASFVVSLVAISIIANAVGIQLGGPSDEGAFYITLLQSVVAWWAMEFIISLTFEDESVVSKLLSSKLAVYLGRISYGVYLIHFLVIQYISYIAYGETAVDASFIPIWCIPVMWIISVILGILLNRFIEEPLRKKLRPSRVLIIGKGEEKEEEMEKGDEELVVGAENDATMR